MDAKRIGTGISRSGKCVGQAERALVKKSVISNLWK